MHSDAVLERLTALERSNRRFKLAFVVLASAVCACAGVTADYESVSAKRIVLTGDGDVELATLLREGGGARLVLNGDDRKARVVLDSSGVRVFEPGGRVVWRSGSTTAAK